MLMQLCSLELLILCFSAAKGSENVNRWVYLKLIWLIFASDQRFLDFGEEFRGYLISLALMQFCSLKSLILCFSTSQRSENHLVYCNLACDFLGPVFSGLGEGFR